MQTSCDVTTMMRVRSFAVTLVLDVMVLTHVASKFGSNRGKTVAAMNGLIFT